MKKTLLFALTALLASCGMNTNQDTSVNNITSAPAKAEESTAKALSERDDYTFNTTFRKNEDNQCDAIVVNCQKGEKSQQFVCEFVWPKDEDILTLEGSGIISEEDINFDGIADLVVYLGNFGVLSTIQFYAAYVWDEGSQSFQEVENYSDLPNAEVDEVRKAIVSSYYNVADVFVEEVYGWENGKLKLIESHTEEEEGDD